MSTDDPFDETPDPVLLRAQQVLAEPDDEAWERVRPQVRDRLRRTVRRSRPVRATLDDLPIHPGDRLVVGEHVVVDAVRRAVVALPEVTPRAVVLHLEPGPGPALCHGVRIDVAVGYRQVLAEVAERVRERVLAVLAEALGPAPRTVDVEVVDVEVQALDVDVVEPPA